MEAKSGHSKMSIIPACHIIKKSQGDGLIEDAVNEILAVIEDDVTDAIDNRKTFSKTELPTTFDIPSMTNERAQKHIYFHVLMTLKKAQYHPTYEFIGKKSETQKVFIIVKWTSKDDQEMEVFMNKYIQMHTIDENPTEIKETPRRRRRRPASNSGTTKN